MKRNGTFSLLAAVISIVFLAGCNPPKEQVTPALDLTQCKATPGGDPFDAARVGSSSENGRTNAVEHRHGYSQVTITGPVYDRDYHIFVRGCTLTNSTSTVEYGYNQRGQNLIDFPFDFACPNYGFGGHRGVLTNRLASTMYPGYVDFDTILGGFRVNHYYTCLGLNGVDYGQLLLGDIGLLVYQ